MNNSTNSIVNMIHRQSNERRLDDILSYMKDNSITDFDKGEAAFDKSRRTDYAQTETQRISAAAAPDLVAAAATVQRGDQSTLRPIDPRYDPKPMRDPLDHVSYAEDGIIARCTEAAIEMAGNIADQLACSMETAQDICGQAAESGKSIADVLKSSQPRLFALCDAQTREILSSWHVRISKRDDGGIDPVLRNIV